MRKLGKNTRALAFAGVFCALTVVIQLATAPLAAPLGPLGQQLVTGSLVNLSLILCCCLAGLLPGLGVGLVTPFVAALCGILPPFLVLLPFMALGNMAIVATWRTLISIKTSRNAHVRRIIAAVCGAIVKTSVLYLGIVRLALPYLTNAPPAQAAKITAMFSLPQMFTALIGGGVACLVLPLLGKVGPAEHKNNS